MFDWRLCCCKSPLLGAFLFFVLFVARVFSGYCWFCLFEFLAVVAKE
jgi:hypothetical protein